MKKEKRIKNNEFIGYCKSCELILCGRDIISCNKWKCPACDTEGFLSKLKKSKLSTKIDKMDEEVYKNEMEVDIVETVELSESKIISLEELEKLENGKEEE